MIRTIETLQLLPAQRAELEALLAAAFGEEFSADDLDHTFAGTHVLLLDDGDGEAILAHAAVVPRELVVDQKPVPTGYVEGVAVLPAMQGRGHGTTVMTVAAQLIRDGYAMGALSTGRTSFYERLGWQPWQGRTFAREAGGALRRTPDDDDSVMVLPFGPSAGVDLRSTISCEARSGDDW